MESLCFITNTKRNTAGLSATSDYDYDDYDKSSEKYLFQEQNSSSLASTEPFEPQIEAKVKEENADVLQQIIILDSSETEDVGETPGPKKHPIDPDPLEISSVTALDEAWFLRLPPEEIHEIQEISTKIQIEEEEEEYLKCTVCSKRLDLNQRAQVHRFPPVP